MSKTRDFYQELRKVIQRNVELESWDGPAMREALDACHFYIQGTQHLKRAPRIRDEELFLFCMLEFADQLLASDMAHKFEDYSHFTVWLYNHFSLKPYTVGIYGTNDGIWCKFMELYEKKLRIWFHSQRAENMQGQ